MGAGPDDYQEIMAHPFFKDIDIKKIESQEIKPPYVPTI